MSNFSVKDIRGVIPAMVTPFDENEALDLARTRALTAKLIEDGAQGLYLTGSTGEGFLCTSDERKAFVETVLDEAAGRGVVPRYVESDIGGFLLIQNERRTHRG